jgi:diguanylate cyclase (GGDEF)-like protein
MFLREGAFAAVRRRVRPSAVDHLTGLGNRRRLREDLRAACESATLDAPQLLVLLTLNGFKEFDAVLGHSAGDALLVRLGERLSTAIGHRGHVYRTAGVDFCVLAEVGRDAVNSFVATALAALAQDDRSHPISARHGAVRLPVETREPGEALHIAGQRLQAGRAHAPRRRADDTVRLP